MLKLQNEKVKPQLYILDVSSIKWKCKTNKEPIKPHLRNIETAYFFFHYYFWSDNDLRQVNI